MRRPLAQAVSRSFARQNAPRTHHPVHATLAAAIMARLTTTSTIVKKTLLLVSDLDDTLLANSTPAAADLDAATAALKALWERSKAAGTNCKLCINTGRTLALFEAAWRSKHTLLPQPDVLIAGVGTRCYYYHHDGSGTGGWVEDAGWTARMDEGWDAAAVRAVLDGLISTFGADNAEYRPADEMHDHKLTVLYDRALRGQVLPQLHSGLQQHAGLQATVIEGGAGRPGWQFIDVLPKNAGKGSAMHHVQQQLGFDDASTVAAGDANNDLQMLQQAPRAIVVGNAVPELKAWARQQQQHQEQQQVVYVASGHVAAGVMEGLEVLGMLDMQPLRN